MVGEVPERILEGNANWGECAATVANRPGWGSVTAVEKSQVIPVDTDTAGRWGPRVVDFLKSVSAAIEKILS